jgi:hypothetical protein
MIRTLLATTAVAAVLALPVIAQDASSSMSSMDSSAMSSMDSSAMDSSMMSSEPSSSAMTDTTSSAVVTDTSSSAMSTVEQPTAPFDIVTGYTQIDSDAFATNIIGAAVYDSAADDANKLGDINDIVLNERGTAQAVIIGVGGFLGIGEKQVAVAYSALQLVAAADGTERYVVETTVDELTAAPDFVVVEDNAGEGTSAPAVTSEAAPAGDTATSAQGDAMATSSSAAQ